MSDEGYRFVPLPGGVRRVARAEAIHDRRIPGAITARLSVVLVTEQPLHIGSGFKTLRDGRIVRRMITSGEQPCAPGSTLKGVLRSRFEAITRSCALFRPGDRSVKVRSSSFPGATARFDRPVLQAQVFQACGVDRLCAACALFGRMSLRSRVVVSDFLPEAPVEVISESMAEMFSPNLHHVGKFTPTHDEKELVVTSLHGRKFACGQGPEGTNRELVEVVPRGTKLAGELRVMNATRAEVGGLLAALGWRPQSRLKVGSGRGHGFGRVRVERCEVHAHAPTQAAAIDIDAWDSAFRASEDAWIPGLDALVKIHGEGC